MADFIGTIRLSGYALGLSVAMILGLAFPVHAATPKPVASDGTRSLRIVAVAGYPVGVAGKGWSKNTLLTVSARTGSKKQTMKLKTTSHGTFRVGVSSLSTCDDFTFTARDKKHHLTIQRLPRQCPVQIDSGPPAITVLQGKQMSARQFVIDVTKPLRSETIHLSDVLYLYTPTAAGPSRLVQSDPTHFQLIDQGTVPACPPNATCPLPSGVFWRFTATHTGEGIVTISFACRQSKPPCMVPDLALRVTILP